jgi:hypothetical protein
MRDQIFEALQTSDVCPNCGLTVFALTAFRVGFGASGLKVSQELVSMCLCATWVGDARNGDVPKEPARNR